jgi:hypothetical protein
MLAAVWFVQWWQTLRAVVQFCPSLSRITLVSEEYHAPSDFFTVPTSLSVAAAATAATADESDEPRPAADAKPVESKASHSLLTQLDKVDAAAKHPAKRQAAVELFHRRLGRLQLHELKHLTSVTVSDRSACFLS